MRAKSDGASNSPKKHTTNYEDGSSKTYRRTQGGLKITSRRHDASQPIKGPGQKKSKPMSGRARTQGGLRMGHR